MISKPLGLFLLACCGFITSTVAADCWINGPYYVCGAPPSLFCPNSNGGAPIDCTRDQSPATGCTVRDVQLAPLGERGREDALTDGCGIVITEKSCPTEPGGPCVIGSTFTQTCGFSYVAGIECTGTYVEP